MAGKAGELFKEIAESIPEARLSKMFGCPCIKAPNGKVGAILWKENLIIKYDKSEIEEQVRKGYKEFSPRDGGRPMKGWIVIPPAQSSSWNELVTQSYERVKALKK